MVEMESDAATRSSSERLRAYYKRIEVADARVSFLPVLRQVFFPREQLGHVGKIGLPARI